MVNKANAEVLSELSNEECDAYLLSESSLFVWHDRFLMLTCGTTTLVEAALYFIAEKGVSDIDFLCYQRKNEYHSQLQKTSLDEDLRRLREQLPMRAFQLGYLDSHHHYLAHYDKPYEPNPEDKTCELLMYHIEGEVADYLRSEGQSCEEIRKKLALDVILEGFELDDFVFSPCGYSINAIRGSEYATIHVTPEPHSSYVSFETNLDLGGSHFFIVKTLLEILKPRTWDSVSFNGAPAGIDEMHAGYSAACELSLDCGYQVQFCHHTDSRTNRLPVLAL
jgi:S-adenosylmethionine decarboxylase